MAKKSPTKTKTLRKAAPTKAMTSALARLKKAAPQKHSLLVLAQSSAAGGDAAAEEVDVEITPDDAEAFINGAALTLSGGKGSMSMLPGHYMLTFNLRGAPGSAWSVKITAPKEAKNEDGDTFDSGGFEAGRIPFVVGP